MAQDLKNQLNEIITILSIQQEGFRNQSQIDSLFELTANYSFFQSTLLKYGLDKVKQCLQWMKLERIFQGATLFRKGDKGDKFYIILSGSVGVYLPFQTSIDISELISSKLEYFEEQQVAQLYQGESFGEIALLNDSPRTATIKVNQDSIFATISKIHYHKILKNQIYIDHKERVEFFSNIKLFSNLRRRTIETIIYHFKHQSYYKDNYIYKQNDESEYIYVIATGSFLLEKIVDQQNEQTMKYYKKFPLKKLISIATLGQSEMFGELECFLSEKRHFSVKCQTVTGSLYAIHKSDFIKRLIQQNEYDSMKIFFKQYLVTKINWRNDIITNAMKISRNFNFVNQSYQKSKSTSPQQEINKLPQIQNQSLSPFQRITSKSQIGTVQSLVYLIILQESPNNENFSYKMSNKMIKGMNYVNKQKRRQNKRIKEQNLLSFNVPEYLQKKYLKDLNQKSFVIRQVKTESEAEKSLNDLQKMLYQKLPQLKQLRQEDTSQTSQTIQSSSKRNSSLSPSYIHYSKYKRKQLDQKTSIQKVQMCRGMRSIFDLLYYLFVFLRIQYLNKYIKKLMVSALENGQVNGSTYFYGYIGVACALVFANLGSAYGTAKSGVGICAMGVLKPDLIMKSVIPVVMAGILGIYGMIVAVILMGRVASAENDKQGFAYLSGGFCCGISSLAAGLAIGIVGDAGVRANAQQDKIFVGMILILIFAEALALYGLIVSLILSQS